MFSALPAFSAISLAKRSSFLNHIPLGFSAPDLSSFLLRIRAMWQPYPPPSLDPCDAFVSVSFSLKNNILSKCTQIRGVLPLSSLSKIVYTHVTSTQIKSTAFPAPRGLFHVSSLLGPLSSSPERLLPCLLTRRFVLPGFELDTVAPRSLYSCKGWLLSICFTLVRFIRVRHVHISGEYSTV